MADEERYSIGELARLAGVTPRTIRYYTGEGLLAPPEARGRYASYSGAHLRRLRAIAELKAAYLPLSAIRERLAGPGQARAPEGAGRSQGEAHSPLALPTVRRGAIEESRAAYMQAGGEPRVAAEPFHLTPATLQTGRVEFFPEELLGEEGELEPPTRWQRLVLAPGVELAVREPISPRRRARLDALIAAARDQLRAEE